MWKYQLGQLLAGCLFLVYVKFLWFFEECHTFCPHAWSMINMKNLVEIMAFFLIYASILLIAIIGSSKKSSPKTKRLGATPPWSILESPVLEGESGEQWGIPLCAVTEKSGERMLEGDVAPVIRFKNPVGGIGLLLNYFGLIKSEGRE